MLAAEHIIKRAREQSEQEASSQRGHGGTGQAKGHDDNIDRDESHTRQQEMCVAVGQQGGAILGQRLK